MTKLSNSEAEVSGDLQILGAAYGLLDVTNLVMNRVNRNTVPQSLPETAASNSLFPDGWRGEDKTLTVFYRYGSNGRIGVATAVEYGKGLSIKGPPSPAPVELGEEAAEPPTLRVLGATYGPADVTGKVAMLVDPKTQSLKFTPDNATFGDPWKRRKAFVALLRYGGETPFLQVVREGDVFECKYSPQVKILAAYWGLMDVSATVLKQVVRGSATIVADRALFGDGWPGKDKTLAIVYQHEQQEPQLAVVKEGKTLNIAYDPQRPRFSVPVDSRKLNIIRAAYGPSDVTAKVKQLVKANGLDITANNATFTDTWRGTDKSFVLTYSWGPSVAESVVVSEGTRVTISDQQMTWDPSFSVPLVNLFGDGDQIMIQATNSSFWKVDARKQIRASAEGLDGGDWFVMKIDSQQPLVISLQSPADEFVAAGEDGTLYANAERAGAAKFTPSLCRDGSVIFGLIGRDALPFIALNQLEAITAGGSPATSPGASFYVSLKSTELGNRNHLAALGLLEGDQINDDPDLLLAEFVYDLTVGLFVALALGPLIGRSINKLQLLRLVWRNNDLSPPKYPTVKLVARPQENPCHEEVAVQRRANYW
ncbi:hypothetical protein, partial [Burkholderia sp. BCC0801]|uniref:hypothetical protein n=1 Tax=Burkholderia sp. BCC0801 TaxID=2676291 RepID=UPI00158B6088